MPDVAIGENSTAVLGERWDIVARTVDRKDAVPDSCVGRQRPLEPDRYEVVVVMLKRNVNDIGNLGNGDRLPVGRDIHNRLMNDSWLLFVHEGLCCAHWS